MTFRNRICSTLTSVAGIALLSGVTALAQAPGGMQQPSTPPGGAPQTQPGMSPMNQNPDMNATPNGQPSPTDKIFVEEALKGGMAEVQLGHLALQKSTNDDVKQFAQRMVDDHTKMGDQLKPIAQQIGVKVPDGPSKKDKNTIAKLTALNGQAFDQAYIKDMVKDHKADLDDFKTEAQNGSDPQVKAAADQGSQVIAQHLQMIQQIAQKDGSMASNGGMK